MHCRKCGGPLKDVEADAYEMDRRKTAYCGWCDKCECATAWISEPRGY